MPPFCRSSSFSVVWRPRQLCSSAESEPSPHAATFLTRCVPFLLLECTYDHFNSSSSCPNCRKTLGADDFMELCVADPSSATQETTKNTFQNILTKFSGGSKKLSHQEMCSRLLKNLDNDRRAVRFLLKQFVFDCTNQESKTGSMGRAFEQLKQEFTQLKQQSSSQRIQYEQTVADLQHRVQALTGTVQEQQKKLEGKENQIAQFRQLYATDGMSRLPSSSHSTGSGKRGRSSEHALSSSQGLRNTEQQPLMHNFAMQKQARERVKEQERRTRAPPFASTAAPESLITPIQLPHRPYSSMSALGPPSTPRIRDLSSSSGYVFTSSRGGSGNGHHDASQRHRSSMSPSNAFVYNKSGASSQYRPRSGSQQEYSRHGTGGVFPIRR
jgi:hypothetical protein